MLKVLVPIRGTRPPYDVEQVVLVARLGARRGNLLTVATRIGNLSVSSRVNAMYRHCKPPANYRH